MNQDIRAPYYGELGRLELLARLGAAGAGDVAGAAAEVQAGGLALRGRHARRSTRPASSCRSSRPSAAT